MREGGEASAASPVGWLPPFRLGDAVLLDGVLEVTHPSQALRPFSRLVLDPVPARFRPEPPFVMSEGEAAPEADLSRVARARRWRLGTALAAAEANAALDRLGDVGRWTEAAAALRRWYLQAVDGGRPPEARHLLDAQHQVPQGLRFLGNALPTAEAVALLRPLGRVCEVGAGFGLFARALERAGLAVAASDPGQGEGTGVAFPVRQGCDAAATIDTFAAMGGVPPLLLLWPQFDEGDWFAEVFARVRPGAFIAMASPEFEFCLGAGLEAATAEERRAAGPGWQAAPALMARLGRDFELAGQAPVVASGWPLAGTPLRLWRRR